jgi:hypothetical protein
MVLAAGCNFISPQTTTEHYDASDGFSTNVGSLDVRNAIVFTEDGGETASLSMTLINNTSGTKTVKFQYAGSNGSQTESVKVPGNSEVRRGTQGGDKQLILTNIGEKPGALLKVFIQYGSQSGKNLEVPVLNGALKEYATLVPSPTISTFPVDGGTPTDSATTIPTDTVTSPAG